MTHNVKAYAMFFLCVASSGLAAQRKNMPKRPSSVHGRAGRAGTPVKRITPRYVSLYAKNKKVLDHVYSHKTVMTTPTVTMSNYVRTLKSLTPTAISDIKYYCKPTFSINQLNSNLSIVKEYNADQY